MSPMRNDHLFRPWRVLLGLICGVAIHSAEFIQVTHAWAQSPRFEVTEATIPQLQATMATGLMTSRDLTAMYLARIEAYDQRGPALNAISVTNPDALDDAAKMDAERRAGKLRGLLHGIPVIVKDNYETANMQTADGSASLKGWIPPDDAYLVRRLRKAGAIIIAKANMHEFAYGVISVGSLFGATRNPYALDRNPGGSSGGTGAAIAANFAAVGMGSDTCGSIRMPASRNSLVGIRGTQGLASRHGIIPLSHTLDIGGPIGRSVTDVAIVLDATVGYDPDDAQTAASVGHVPGSYTDFLKLNGLRGARIGVLNQLFKTAQADEQVNAVASAAVQEMRKADAEVVDVEIPGLRDLLTDRNSNPGWIIIRQEFKSDFNAYLDAHPTAPVRSLAEVIASKKYHPFLQNVLNSADAVESRDTKDYLEHVVKIGTVREAVLKAMADNRVDVLVYPTLTSKPSMIGQAGQTGLNCKLSPSSGLPAIVVPGGFTPDGIPVGIEFMGRPWSEPELISFAYSYEQSTRHRRPPASTPPLQ